MSNPAPVVGIGTRAPEAIPSRWSRSTATTPRSKSSISTARSRSSISTSGATSEIVAASPPEDWTGSVDVDPEDTENEFDLAPGNGNSPFDAIDRGEADGYSELELPDEQQERPSG